MFNFSYQDVKFIKILQSLFQFAEQMIFPEIHSSSFPPS